MQRNVSSSSTEGVPLLPSPSDAKKKEQTKISLKNIVDNIGPFLQSGAKANPYADACVSTLMRVLQYEVDRQENDEQIASALKSMSNMVTTIQYLNPAVMEDEQLASQLKLALTAMNEEMKTFEAFAAKYYAKKIISRIITSKGAKSTLRQYVERFKGHQDHMIMILGVRADMRVKDVRETLYSVEGMLRGMQTSPFADPTDTAASEEMEEMLEESLMGAVANFDEERKAAKAENEMGIEVSTQELVVVVRNTEEL
ncbi:hypothetical protein EXIGLDRAFT_257155 [Exidia glandulosa HHB12029]|uniref:Uncharacterized protein n=1 Tax=Exidia glandulosa HHB12029 TaxID=1314781 RepID=A0A165DUE9_EXIGL|nr:hypothetical protein EXIGLDRAFT_257155 [Exidia glandulosa HHB12029]